MAKQQPKFAQTIPDWETISPLLNLQIFFSASKHQQPCHILAFQLFVARSELLRGCIIWVLSAVSWSNLFNDS